ncbi:MAG: GspH/FimT family pseudopilin [Desulfobacteraceae bacterium]|jgi:prepilin-type N-terminal cleavage/methylation domain-containing protein
MKADRQNCQCSNPLKAGIRGNPPGFTLIELMVCVVVIAILGAAAVPAVNGYLSRHALQYATDELYGDIQLARMRAARNNQQCRIVFNVPAANQYSIFDVGNDGAVSATPFKVVDLAKYRDNITFCPSPNGADPPPYATLEFLSQGIVNLAVTVPGNSDSVYLTNQANDVFYRLLVSAAGGTGADRWDASLNQWR